MSRTDAYVRVSCDECKDPRCDDEIELTPLVGRAWGDRNVDGALRRSGWKKEGDRDICPECVERRAEKEEDEKDGAT